MKDYDNAIHEFELALKLDTKTAADVFPSLIFIYVFRDDVKAVAYLKQLKAIDPQAGRSLANQVFHARIWGLKEEDGGFESQHTFIDQREASSKFFETMEKADALVKSGKYEQAISIYSEFSKRETLTPNEKAYVFYTIGTLYSTKLNQPLEALPFLRQAIDLDPEELYYRMSLLEIYSQLQLGSKALEEINKLLKIDPHNKIGLFFEGGLYFEKRNWPKAIESWLKLRNIDHILFALIEEEYNKAKDLSQK